MKRFRKTMGFTMIEDDSIGFEISYDNMGLGRLVEAEKKSDIDYRVFEISKYSLGIIARGNLGAGLRISLKSAVGDIPFRIDSYSAHEVPRGYLRYVLNSENLRFDLEKYMHKLGFNRKMLAQKNDTHIEFGRFSTNNGLRISVNTFGPTPAFHCTTLNVSRSGLLFAPTSAVFMPFRVNTLLEITIKTDEKFVSNEIRCLAKVVRKRESERPNDTHNQYFGVQFIEFQEMGQMEWMLAVAHIERDANDHLLDKENIPELLQKKTA